MTRKQYIDGNLIIDVSVRTNCNVCAAVNHNNHNKHLAHKKKWRETHKEYERARKESKGYEQIRRQRLKASRGLITVKEWLWLSKANCAYCGSPGGEVDHIIPLARGGDHTIGNLTSSCKRCNQSKGSKLLIEWKRDANR